MLHVILRNNETGEAAMREMDIEWHGPYVWEEGNFRCDCNRGIFLYGDDSDIDCSEDLIAIDAIYENGELRYRDKPEDA